MRDAHELYAILDAFSDSPVVCRHPGLWRDGAAAMRVALMERADDLRLAVGMLDEDPMMAVRLMRTVAGVAQQCALSVEIAERTGRRMCANRAKADAEE